MLTKIRSLASAALLSGAASLSGSSAAIAYPIDCAILLCLSGGWPASAECTAARTVFIRRITPWPVEPPLQIWRCPMSAGIELSPEMPVTRFGRLVEEQGISTGFRSVTSSTDPTSARAFAIALAEAIAVGTYVPERITLAASGDYSDANGTADIDISSPDFEFVRSIRVYDIDWQEYDHENSQSDHDCRRWRQRVRIGKYGTQGDFAWNDVHVTAATSQTWLGFTTRARESCAYEGSYRGVGVEWRDYEGNRGFEVVRY